MIKPVLEDLIAPAKTNEEPPEASKLALLLLFLHEGQHGPREGPDSERKDLLKGDHQI